MTNMLKNIWYKYKINNLIKNNFAFERAATPEVFKTNLKKSLESFVRENKYQDLEYVINESKTLAPLNERIAYNFIQHAEYFTSDINRQDLDYVLNVTKDILKRKEDINITTILDVYLESTCREDFETTLYDSIELSHKLNTSIAHQFSNISPTFLELYQYHKKRLEKNAFNEYIASIENQALIDVKKARNEFGCYEF